MFTRRNAPKRNMAIAPAKHENERPPLPLPFCAVYSFSYPIDQLTVTSRITFASR
ncbi:hypothetical protein ANO14919_060910 [Xylariales sp. No.14919]|nr:hypothetical protein ANO14919_060910 [Xylariales sp. No.14919]